MKKRILCVLICALLIFSFIPITVSAADIAVNETNFPDREFRLCVQSYDSNSNGYLSSSELSAVKSMDVAQRYIKNTKGLEYFTSLEELIISYNFDLKELDASSLKNLKRIECEGCALTALDLSANTKLTSLYAANNKLETLKFGSNTNLGRISVGGNRLTSIDLSGTPNISTVYASNNSYTITVSGDGTFDLSTLPGGFNASKTSDWVGGSVSGNILTVDSDAETVTYYYNCGSGIEAQFTLNVEYITDYTIWLEGGTVYANEKGGRALTDTGITGVKNSDGSYTYTFDNVNFETLATTAVRVADENVTVNVKGDNFIKSAGGASEMYGIFFSAATFGENVNVTIKGDGTLKVQPGGTYKYGTKSYGICVWGSLCIADSNTTLDVMASDESSMNTFGIYTTYELKVTAGTVNSAAAGSTGKSHGIFASFTGSVTVSGGTVNARGGNDSPVSDGISTPYLTVEGGTVNTYGGNGCTQDSYGVFVEYTMDVSGGKINAEGGSAKGLSCGIWCDNLTVTEGEITAVTAKTDNKAYGIYAGNYYSGSFGAKISGGNISCIPGKAGGSCAGMYINNNGTFEMSGGYLSAAATSSVTGYGIVFGFSQMSGGEAEIFASTYVTVNDGGEIAPAPMQTLNMDAFASTDTKAENAVELSDWDETGNYNIYPYKYMRFAPHHDHGNGTFVKGQAASCKTHTDGTMDHYVCSCGETFADKACTIAISNVVITWAHTGTATVVSTTSVKYSCCNTVAVKGDVNGDGNINTADLFVIKQALLGSRVLGTGENFCADMNGDGKVNTTDLNILKKKLLGQ